MNLTLPDFIAEIGDAEFARRLKTPIRTVQSWRRRERLPRPAQAEEIIRLAAGRLDYDAIYKPAQSDGGQPASEPLARVG